MKICTFLTVALPLFSPLSAAIIFTEVNDSISRPSTPPFLEYDLNEDGVLDEEERQAAKDARKNRAKEKRASWDTDEDGEISEEEREAARI